MIQNSLTEDIYKKANEEFQKKIGTYRWGQVLWNTAEAYVKGNCSTDIIDSFIKLKNSEEDCYYSNDRVEKFVKALDRIFEENPENK